MENIDQSLYLHPCRSLRVKAKELHATENINTSVAGQNKSNDGEQHADHAKVTRVKRRADSNDEDADAAPPPKRFKSSQKVICSAQASGRSTKGKTRNVTGKNSRATKVTKSPSYFEAIGNDSFPVTDGIYRQQLEDLDQTTSGISNDSQEMITDLLSGQVPYHDKPRNRSSRQRQGIQSGSGLFSNQQKRSVSKRNVKANQSSASSPCRVSKPVSKLRRSSKSGKGTPESLIVRLQMNNLPEPTSEIERESSESDNRTSLNDDDSSNIVVRTESQSDNRTQVTDTKPVTPKNVVHRDAQPFQTPVRLNALELQQVNGLPTPPDSQTRSRIHVQPDIDKGLLELSKKLTYRETLETKPEPQGEPLVWAESRQALIETVPYFKMPQSGCHQNDGHVYAFLFDGISGNREYMDTDMIIARAGGGMEANADGSGKMIAGKNHEMKESQVKAVLNDIAHQNPLIIICGDKNEGARCAMPHKYNVLGWYKPIAVWAEKTAGNKGKVWTTIKYRFERLNNEELAWHAPKEATVTDEDRQTAGDIVRACCSRCRREFDQVYLVAWLCLNPECCAFWKIDGDGQDAEYGELDYHPAFLLHRTRWQQEVEPYSVRPAVPDVGNTIGDNITRINTRGICCPECGRCSPRRLWKGWQCDNTGCAFEFVPQHTPVKPAMLHNPWDMKGEGPSLSRNKFAPGVRVEVEHIEGFKINRYTFEGIDGCLIHAVANKNINERPKGSDEMFEAMQKHSIEGETLPLERRRFCTQRTSDGKPEDGDLMMAFSMNYGMPYKFVASGASQSFEESPWPVRTCRSTLNRASELFLDPKQHVDFNEELIFAYMEGQKIEYHDDGEEGLGPRIATLSLGAKAKMHLRMKRKHYVGCSLQGVFTKERPKPGGIDGPDMDRKRLEAWEQLQKMRETDKASYDKQKKRIPRKLGLFEKRSKSPPDLVTLALHHGDIVLMEGYEIQQYLEHKVVPEGNLRFAMTCRTVLENHLSPEERPDYEVSPGDGADSFI